MNNLWINKWMLQPVRRCCKGVLAMGQKLLKKYYELCEGGIAKIF